MLGAANIWIRLKTTIRIASLLTCPTPRLALTMPPTCHGCRAQLEGYMSSALQPLGLTALSIGFLHTMLGPDHYVPFVAMARIGKWSLSKTMIVTLLCGVAHVGSSALLGLIGVTVGIAVFKLNAIETLRGNVAGWLLLSFGLVYFIWGIRSAVRNRPHTHLHVHGDGTIHAHKHTHQGRHLHVHAATAPGRSAMTPWVLFTIFAFGPCEPLIPLVMYPAAQGNFWSVGWVTCLFGMVTLATMTTIVSALYVGVDAIALKRLERYGHAAAGFAILACGVAVTVGF